MNQLMNVLQVILAVFLYQCHSLDDSQVNDISDYEADNEVNHELNYINSSLPHVNTNSNKTKCEIVREIAAKEENVTMTLEAGVEEVDADNEMVSNEGAGCMYQNSNSKEEYDDNSKSTLIDYPFSVSVQKTGSHYVSGALIDKNWILSVAGEFYHVRESLKLFRARLGSVDCKRGGILVPIKALEIHPYYIYGKPSFDISLLRMAMPIKFSEVISPIGISNINGKVLSAKFMTTYWPRIVRNGKTISENAKERTKHNSMRVSTQRLIPEDVCQNVMAAIKERINESSLCLKSVVTHHSVCMPDSGAPVIADDGLWGITSGWISPMCPNFAGPTIFTRLSSPSVRSWLDVQLKLQV